MDFWLDFRLKVRDFFKKYRLIILIGIIAIAIIFTIGFAVSSEQAKKKAREDSINKVETPVIDTKGSLPEGYDKKINELISNYFNYCNNKEYENAYALLQEEFKSIYFKNINKFKKYIDIIFKEKKMYNIQNYSNIGDVYVYNVVFMDDILASGTTENYEYMEDKFVILEEKGELKLALNGYCGSEELNINVEDEYMNIKVVRKRMIYDKEIYTVEFTNKTSNYIVLANGEEKAEFCLNVGDQTKVADTVDANVYLKPNEKRTENITFQDKFFDDGKVSKQLILNAIRVLPQYSGDSSKLSSEMKKAIKLYSRKINLIPGEIEDEVHSQSSNNSENSSEEAEENTSETNISNTSTSNSENNSETNASNTSTSNSENNVASNKTNNTANTSASNSSNSTTKNKTNNSSSNSSNSSSSNSSNKTKSNSTNNTTNSSASSSSSNLINSSENNAETI